MKSLLDVTKEEVLEAYKKTGLKPKTGSFIDRDGACCAGGALIKSEGQEPGGYGSMFIALRAVGIDAGDWACSGTFGCGFDDGFRNGRLDLESCDALDIEAFLRHGYEIGQFIRQAVDRGEL